MRGELIYVNPQSSSRKKSNSMTTEDDFFVCVNTINDTSDRKIKEQRIIFQLGTLQHAGMNIKFTVVNARCEPFFIMNSLTLTRLAWTLLKLN